MEMYSQIINSVGLVADVVAVWIVGSAVFT